MTADVLGRMVKAEELNWDGSVYSTANYSDTVLDQVSSIMREGQVPVALSMAILTGISVGTQ